MTVIRTKNQFGCRYLSLKKICDYVVDLDLMEHAPNERFIEYLESEGLLLPILRLRFPAGVLRRFEREHDPAKNIVGYVQPDGKRFTAALDLWRATDTTHWEAPYIYGESEHPLDVIRELPSQFVVTDFSRATFLRWEKIRATVGDYKGRPIYSNARYTPCYYHYWQVFWIATLIRACVTLQLPLDDEALLVSILKGELHKKSVLRRTYRSMNLDARHHLNELREYQPHFSAVGHFAAYHRHALQVHMYDRDPESGRLSLAASRTYRRRERQIARQVLRIYKLKPRQLMGFIRQQSRWWDDAHRRGPARLADEYKRNLAESINCYRLVTRCTLQSVVDQVGRRGHYRPVLDEIFPDWLEDQRALTIRSLLGWASRHLGALPSPFDVSEAELGEFCDWLEAAGLHQYYWHFKRLADVGFGDGHIHRAGTAAEAVGFANLCEMIANRVLEDRGKPARGKTLGPKLRILFGPRSQVDFTAYFDRYGHLTSTRTQSLAKRRSQIRRLNQGGDYAAVLRALLDLWVIRNEGSHLGLLRYDRVEIIKMIESMSMASLMIWRVR